jgi:formylglycine-generating enzyme
MRVRQSLVSCGAAIVVALSVATAQADVFNMPSGQTSLSFVPVGDANNQPDLATGNGAVAQPYRMGTYDVTVAQYCDFLNAVAKDDTYGLYNGIMGAGYVNAGVTRINVVRSGTPGNYSYAVGGACDQAANCPIFAATWADAARFSNWLQNGQPTFPAGTKGQVPGSTETGAYTLNGINDNYNLMQVTREPGAKYFIPTLDEWYKAAYYKGGGTDAGYWLYPTKHDDQPGNTLSDTDGDPTNKGNYYTCATCSTDIVNHITPVGVFTQSSSPYGTFDQGGNVNQWTEAVSLDSSMRTARGGDWDHTYNDMKSIASGTDSLPAALNGVIGFRVGASPVPEPGTIALLLAGAVSVLAYAWRRKTAS